MSNKDNLIKLNAAKECDPSDQLSRAIRPAAVAPKISVAGEAKGTNSGVIPKVTAASPTIVPRQTSTGTNK